MTPSPHTRYHHVAGLANNFHSRMQPDVGNTPSVTSQRLAAMFLLNTSSPHLL